ncbi:MAG: tRNA epoxyqueuosine(34) reductase QueG [Alphaproteobacteria bacterium]|nr:tRNA epoxyqueuosine(34) reductase QueG [Alphaproteobacteria bacterium]
MSNLLQTEITNRATAEGFNAVGFAKSSGSEAQTKGLRAFLENKYYGDMLWLPDTADRRHAPNAMWSEAKTAIVLALNYGPEIDPIPRLEETKIGVISVYALGHDYHDLIKKKLKRLARWLAETQSCQVKVFVDTAPLMEKPLAQTAGIGWQGKHTNLVSREHGSWLFLGTILTDLELEPDAPETDHCGNCQACLDICPTNAFPAPYQLNARRCISYLTIEHKGHISADLRPDMGNHIFGCDDCLAVCPWNKFASEGREAKLAARDHLISPDLAHLAGLDDAAFRALFQASPVKRAGRDRFIRNVLIAIGNSGEIELAAQAENLLCDASTLVRAMAVWALLQLLDEQAFGAVRKKHRADENDPAVLAEWGSD